MWQSDSVTAHPRRPVSRVRALVARAAIALACTAAAGCKTVETRTSSGPLVPPDSRATPPRGGSASQTSVSLRAYGTIPYDGFTLPLLSMDARFVATQTGVAPTWSTLLGLPSGGTPRASGIDVFAIEHRPGAAELKKEFSLPRGYVLTRAVTSDGFLIEAPQSDGSRRIGLVRWPQTVTADASQAEDPEGPASQTSVEWLVLDERLNLFPAVSPDGTLAWCARALDAADCSLMVRRGDTVFEILPEEGQSWLLPTFAADGTLFAFRVRDGIAEIAHAVVNDQDAFEQSLVVERVSVRADAQRVWQALAPVDAASAIEPASVAGAAPCLFFLSAELSRMVAWTPGVKGVRPLAEGSFAMCVGEDGTMLWSDSDGVVAVPPTAPVAGTAEGTASSQTLALSRRTDGPRVYNRPAVPRRISGDPQSFILFVPDRRALAVVRMTLVTPPRLVGGAPVK